MTTDHSAGWEAVSDQFIAVRSEIGAALVLGWATDGFVAKLTLKIPRRNRAGFTKVCISLVEAAMYPAFDCDFVMRRWP